MNAMLRKLAGDDARITAIECAFLGAVIGIAIAAVVGTVGSSLATTFAALASSF